MKISARAGRILPSLLPSLVLVGLLSAASACGEGDAPAADPPDAATSQEAASSEEAAERGAEAEADAAAQGRAGIPEGGLEQWVTDIRRGLEEVELNPRESAQRVLELYTTRQEYIELFYGPNGRITGEDHPELAEAVMAQEERFHELMELTGTDQRIQRERILGGVQELRLALNRTMERAQEAGVPLDRPDDEG